MKSKIILLLIILCILNYTLKSQEVTTLVTDSQRTFEAMHWLEDGRILSVDYNNGNLYEIHLDGTVTTLVTDFTNLAGGGTDNAENFYFSGIATGTVHKLNDDNTYTTVVSGINQPVGILKSNQDNEIFVASYGANILYRVNVNTGEKKPFAVGGGINGPDDLIYHSDGDILIANFNNNQIHKVSSDGTVSPFVTIPENGFLGYMAHGVDRFYTVSITGRKVFEITMDGEILHIAGSGLIGTKDGSALEATFEQPNGMALSPTGDTLLVADKNRIRLIYGLNTTTSLTDDTIGLNLNLSPNPVFENLSLEYPQELGIKSVEITNMLGHKLYIDDVSKTISTSFLSSGYYLISFYDNDHKLLGTKKFMKSDR